MRRMNLTAAGALAAAAIAGGAAPATAADTCRALSLKETADVGRRAGVSAWVVPRDGGRVYISSGINSGDRRGYVVAGDLLVSRVVRSNFACVTYFSRGRATAFGWVDMRKLQTLGALPSASRSTGDVLHEVKGLAALALSRPDWRGQWRNARGDELEFWRRGSTWMLNPDRVTGVVSTGDPLEDSSPVEVDGPLAVQYPDPEEATPPAARLDPCTLFLVAFNNALLAVGGHHCLGSGVDSSWPEINGVYWRS